MTRLIEKIPTVELSSGLVRFELTSFGVDGKTPGLSEVYALTPHAAFALSQALSRAAIQQIDKTATVTPFSWEGGEVD